MYEPRTIPKYVFRVWDESSFGANSEKGFRAGLDMEGKQAALPPPIFDAAFTQAVDKHLDEVKEASPFISVTQKPLRALHLAFKRRKMGRPGNDGSKRVSTNKPMIAVIDLHCVSGSTMTTNRVYPARPLAAFLGIEHYKGGSEWLVWRQIRQDAIVRAWSIDSLERFLGNDGQPLGLAAINAAESPAQIRAFLRVEQVCITPIVARAIGKLASLIASDLTHLDAVVLAIIKDWGFSWEGADQDALVENLMDGVRRGVGKLGGVSSNIS
ncbi:MAG: hypothetical protein M1825_000212 [Sarcosagium campestre]|nr:MAG: hypothetical protein M1825_000212 [Sarcosagium campestre]